MFTEGNYKQVSQRKRAARDDHILRTFKVLSKEGANHNSGAGSTMNEYTSASAMAIVANIKARKWTARAILEAYILRAIETQHAVNCFTESTYGLYVRGIATYPILRPVVYDNLYLLFFPVLFEEALKQADTLDEEFESTGRLRGPLHGVPFTAKDTCTCHSPAICSSLSSSS